MQENRKTLIFVIVAAIAVFIAWEPWRSAPAGNNVPAEVGTKLFPDFTDPLAAKSLEIVTFDEDTISISDFKVAQVNGVWSIPSHGNYPADAKEHMAEAANALLDLEILGVMSSSPTDRELYGVVAPDSETRAGAVGVGTRVTLKDDKEKVLADVVIGKEIKDQPALRFVRRADHDQIYRVAVRTDKFSTKFGDWIEKDLLKLNAYDVREVELNDYSLTENLSPQGVTLLLKRRSREKLTFDDAKSNWNVVEMTTFDPKAEPVPAPLTETEELNTEKLNALKTALDDLQIVDVQRKPKGLSQDLRASEEFVKNDEARMSLIERGFYPVPPEYDIYSSEGEATCTTKEGVRYILRFGNLSGGTKGKDDAADGEKAKSNPALNRYLFVMAQFDDSQIPKPQFEPLPGEATPAAAPVDEKPAADEPKPAAEPAKPADSKPQPKAPSTKPAAKNPAANKVPQKKTGGDDAADEPKPDSPPAEAPKAAAATDAPPSAEPAAEPKADKPATPLDEQRIIIEKENKRKQDEYDAAIKKGQDRVKELNDRFADWYFIISDDVYKKIHLGRADIVKTKDADKDDADKSAGDKGDKLPNVGDLKELEKSLKGK
jgi:hypothetical protein